MRRLENLKKQKQVTVCRSGGFFVPASTLSRATHEEAETLRLYCEKTNATHGAVKQTTRYHLYRMSALHSARIRSIAATTGALIDNVICSLTDLQGRPVMALDVERGTGETLDKKPDCDVSLVNRACEQG
jgi:hypothetical protein